MHEQLKELVDTIIRVMVDRLDLTLDAASLSSDTKLVGGGLVLDSMAILEIVTGVEDELGIMVDESQLEPEVFENIGTLARFLSEQTG